MNDLLQLAVDAHGGLDRWNALTSVDTDLSLTGAIWSEKGKPDVFRQANLKAQLHTEHIIVSPVSGAGGRSVFNGKQQVLETGTGEVLERRDDPEAPFFAALDAPWDDMQAAYFTSEALWTYLTTPFLYTYPGFEIVEVEPWHENGEVWRSLQVTFPDHIASHTRTQTSHFGPDGLLRRHTYTVDILGGATGANYACGYAEIGGIMMPMRRRVYGYDDEKHKVPEPLLVAIDFHTVSFT